MIRVNTSNPGKLAEFRALLAPIDSHVEALSIDLQEPVADALTVVQYKASQFDRVLVDDVSLEVEGVDVGANIKWMLSQILNWEGRRATFICLIGICRDGRVDVFRGESRGIIVKPRGASYGFNPYFQPDGSTQTLAENKADQWNARYHALQNFSSNKAFKVLPVLKNWNGPFQNE